MELEGTIRIRRTSGPSDPEPWTYMVLYAPYRWGLRPVPQRECRGDEGLNDLLGAVGVDEIPRALTEARVGSWTIHHVRLTEDRLRELRMIL